MPILVNFSEYLKQQRQLTFIYSNSCILYPYAYFITCAASLDLCLNKSVLGILDGIWNYIDNNLSEPIWIRINLTDSVGIDLWDNLNPFGIGLEFEDIDTLINNFNYIDWFYVKHKGFIFKLGEI